MIPSGGVPAGELGKGDSHIGSAKHGRPEAAQTFHGRLCTGDRIISWRAMLNREALPEKAQVRVPLGFTDHHLLDDRDEGPGDGRALRMHWDLMGTVKCLSSPICSRSLGSTSLIQ